MNQFLMDKLSIIFFVFMTLTFGFHIEFAIQEINSEAFSTIMFLVPHFIYLVYFALKQGGYLAKGLCSILINGLFYLYGLPYLWLVAGLSIFYSGNLNESKLILIMPFLFSPIFSLIMIVLLVIGLTSKALKAK